MLKEKMSLEQISGRLLKIKAIRISYESIYQYIWDDKKNGGDLYKHLRQQGKKRNKGGSKLADRGLIAERKDIELKQNWLMTSNYASLTFS
jgi:IS30 family transposase